MRPDDEDEPEVGGGPPPDPSTRSWRHPSEIAAANAAAARDAAAANDTPRWPRFRRSGGATDASGRGHRLGPLAWSSATVTGVAAALLIVFGVAAVISWPATDQLTAAAGPRPGPVSTRSAACRDEVGVE
ncbi:MAG: hypothetical protein ACK5PP_07010, partial [Acidimicrobiales bacterium]